MPNNITRQYQRRIKNPVELLRWSSFTKIVKGYKVINEFCRKYSTLEVLLDSQYTLGDEMLLDLVNRTSSERKVKKNMKTSKFEYAQGPLGDVLGTSSGRPESTSQGRSLNVRLRYPLDVISRCSQDVRLGRPRDFRSRRPQDGQRGSLGDVLGTNICWLGTLSQRFWT